MESLKAPKTPVQLVHPAPEGAGEGFGKRSETRALPKKLAIQALVLLI